MRFFQLCVSVWLITWQDLHLSMCLSVWFPQNLPLYIALNRTLVLKAQITLEPREKIFIRTWERSNDFGDIRVAENDRMNNRTFMEENGALLRIIGVTEGDFGIYKLTVTTEEGYQATASREVRKQINPPSILLYMHCSIFNTSAQWDTPVYSWTVDGVEQPNDNNSLLLLKNLGQNYSCTTDSSQGMSRVEVHMKAPTPCSCVVWIVGAVIEFIIICGLIGLYCYHRKSQERNNL